MKALPKLIMIGSIVGALGINTVASALYSTARIGSNIGPTYFSDRCTNYHDSGRQRLLGIIGYSRSDVNAGRLTWIASQCVGGRTIGPHGNGTGTDPNRQLLCDYSGVNSVVNGLSGYYSSTQVNGLMVSCNAGVGTIPGRIGSTAGSYKSIRCRSSDVAWGIFGGNDYQRPLANIGLLCDPPTLP